MLIDRVVINASPLIILFRGHLESLLPVLFSEICIPEAVWSEVTGRGYRDESVSGLINAEWAKKVKVSNISSRVAAWDLGVGESEVLSFALEHLGFRAALDDKAARRCARTLGIQTLGTGGMLVLAKRRGLIESVAAELYNLRRLGLWLSDELVDLFLEEAGEK
jgi:predicted nucleic acid-binding protein